jgi:hypothetical protein
MALQRMDMRDSSLNLEGPPDSHRFILTAGGPSPS